MAKLSQLAQVIRSKNSGPFEITFDVIFNDAAIYWRVKSSGVLTADRMPLSDVRALLFFDPAQAFKFTLRRNWAQGSSGERDTFGTQQHAPLLDIEIPEAEATQW